MADTETVPIRQIRAGDYVRSDGEWVRVEKIEPAYRVRLLHDATGEVVRSVWYGKAIERIPAKEVDDER